MPIEIRSDPPSYTQAILAGLTGFNSRKSELDLLCAQQEAAQKQKLYDAIGGAVGQIGSGYFEGLQKRRMYDMQLERDELQHQDRMEELNLSTSVAREKLQDQQMEDQGFYRNTENPGYTHNKTRLQNDMMELKKSYAKGEINQQQYSATADQLAKEDALIKPPWEKKPKEPTPDEIKQALMTSDGKSWIKKDQYGNYEIVPIKAEKEEDDESTVTFKAVEAEMGRLQGMADQQAKTAGSQPRMVTFQEAYQSLTNRKAEFRGATGQMTPEETQQVGEATSLDYVLQQHGPEPSQWPPAVRIAMVPRARRQLQLIRESWGEPSTFTEEQRNRLRLLVKVLDPNAGN